VRRPGRIETENVEGKIKVDVSFVICGENRGVKRGLLLQYQSPVMYKHLPKLLNYPGEDESYAETGIIRNIKLEPCPRDRSRSEESWPIRAG
jgi:hypothetical protein